MKLKLKGQSWPVTLSLAGAAVAYVLFMFLPEQRSIGDVRDELDTKRQFIAGVQMVYSTIEVAQKELQETRRYCQQWVECSPDETKLSTLFAKINLATKQAGATTTRFEPQGATDYETLHQIELSLVVSGSYTNIFDFLRRLEMLDEAIWLNDVRFEASKQAGQALRCEVSLAIFAVNPEKSE